VLPVLGLTSGVLSIEFCCHSGCCQEVLSGGYCVVSGPRFQCCEDRPGGLVVLSGHSCRVVVLICCGIASQGVGTAHRESLCVAHAVWHDVGLLGGGHGLTVVLALFWPRFVFPCTPCIHAPILAVRSMYAHACPCFACVVPFSGPIFSFQLSRACCLLVALPLQQIQVASHPGSLAAHTCSIPSVCEGWKFRALQV
jgi:hypothetical protein